MHKYKLSETREIEQLANRRVLINFSHFKKVNIRLSIPMMKSCYL